MSDAEECSLCGGLILGACLCGPADYAREDLKDPRATEGETMSDEPTDEETAGALAEAIAADVQKALDLGDGRLRAYSRGWRAGFARAAAVLREASADIAERGEQDADGMAERIQAAIARRKP